jgi:hypothetical protein
MRFNSSPPRGREVADLSNERIVVGNSSVVFDAQNLSNVRQRILRQFSDVPVAACNEKKAGLIECDTRPIAVAVCRTFSTAAATCQPSCAKMRLGNEDVLAFRQRRTAVPFRAIDRER